jgi:hypothetical protein
MTVTEESEKSLDDMSVADLRERASALEITGRSTMNRDELLQSVKDAEEQTARMDSDSSSSGSSSSGKAEAEVESASDADSDSKSAESDSDSDSDSKSEWDPPDSSSDGEEDASDITAPSIGPNTTIEHIPPDERLDMDKISDVDAMGLDKRRQVGGQRYGASPAKQAAIYGGALALIIALGFGAKLLADELDQPPAVQEDTAPWADAEQQEPAPIDFPRSTEQ